MGTGGHVHEGVVRRVRDELAGADGCRWAIGRRGWVEFECRGGVLFAAVFVESSPKIAFALTSRGAVRALLMHVRFARRLEAIALALDHGVC